ncbi:MAG: polyprenyl diphosphate synthase [Bacilli bacterium]
MQTTKTKVIPLKHLAIIMDGNRRYAKSIHRPKEYGHYLGVNKIHDLVDWCLERNIAEVTLYTFSLDNWKREEGEVNYLFSLVSDFFKRYLEELIAKGVHLNWVGLPTGLPKEVSTILKASEKQSKKCHKLTLNLAFNYGGQKDVAIAAQRIAKKVKKGQLKLQDIDEAEVRSNLLSKKVSSIDLLIRTSGEERISDFMPLQLSYSELYFTKVYWPSFSEIDLDKAIQEYYSRQRRFGGE